METMNMVRSAVLASVFVMEGCCATGYIFDVEFGGCVYDNPEGATDTDTDTGTGAFSTGHQPCGDGLVGPGEECDDGDNNQPGLACDPMCKKTICGDGIVQKPNGNAQNEQCDDGNQSSADGCNLCKKTVCGDGIVQKPNGNGQDEQCDDGNQSSADQCNNMCMPTWCGDGLIQEPNGNGQDEQCDDGPNNGKPNSTCTGTCMPTPGADEPEPEEE